MNRALLALTAWTLGACEPSEPPPRPIAVIQPPEAPQEVIDALGAETARFMMALCFEWSDDWVPQGVAIRPEVRLPDGRMECDPAFDFVEPADRRPIDTTPECPGWPYRPPTPFGPYSPGTPSDTVSCSPDRSLCCTGSVDGDLACQESWTTCRGEQREIGRINGQRIAAIMPTEECPPDVIEAFPTALNMCHYLCQHVCGDPRSRSVGEARRVEVRMRDR